MVKTKTIIAVIVILIFAIAGPVVWYVLHAEREHVAAVGSVTVGISNTEVAWVLYIADELRLFTGNGVKVTLRSFESGLDAYKTMLNGGVDVSSPTEYVVVGGVFRHEKTQIIATVAKADFFHIIGRRDHGIEKAADLAGKRIGLAQRTIEEFYLGRFLDLHGMSIRDVTLVDMSFSVAVGAIKEGQVDAVVTLPPYYDSIKSFFGDGLADWSAQSGQWLFAVITGRNDWIARNPDLAARFLKAIDQANLYIVQHPKETKAIVQKRLNLDAASVERAWQRNYYSLSLDQSLLIAMEDEARWMIKNNLTKEITVPDFTKYIDFDGLKAVKPEAVNIFR